MATDDQVTCAPRRCKRRSPQPSTLRPRLNVFTGIVLWLRPLYYSRTTNLNATGAYEIFPIDRDLLCTLPELYPATPATTVVRNSSSLRRLKLWVPIADVREERLNALASPHRYRNINSNITTVELDEFAISNGKNDLVQ